MIVVADTSPLNYLLLIDEIDLLPGRHTEGRGKTTEEPATETRYAPEQQENEE